MNLRKRDSEEIKRRCQFSYSELLCKIIYYLLYLELRWSERTTEHGYCYLFTVKKWHSLGSFDIMYIIELPDQYKFNGWTCKCNKAFYFQFFHPRYCADTTGKNVKMWIAKVHHTKSSWWREYQFCGIMWNWMQCSAKVMNFWPQLLRIFICSWELTLNSQLMQFCVAIQNLILTLQYTGQWSTARNHHP